MALGHIERRDLDRFARGLGYFSVGLGLTEVAATRTLANGIGISDVRPGLIRAMGMREMANGLGILAAPRRPQWMWSRVAGDAIDIGLLALAFTSPRTRRGRISAAITAVAGVTLLDVICARLLSRSRRYRQVTRRRLSATRGIRIQKSVAINSSPSELYRFCRDPSNLSKIVNNLHSVTEIADRRWRWSAKDSAGKNIHWLTQIVEERADELISWRTLDSEPLENSGSIRLIPGLDGRGTIVRVEMLFRPMQRVGTFLQMLRVHPEFVAAEALRRLKALMETGEIPTTNGQPSGRPPALPPVDQEVGRPLGLRALLAR